MALRKESVRPEQICSEPFDPKKGWPNGIDIYYECMICGDFVHSTEDDECRCRNVFVDAGSGRAGAKREVEVKVVKISSS